MTRMEMMTMTEKKRKETMMIRIKCMEEIASKQCNNRDSNNNQITRSIPHSVSILSEWVTYRVTLQAQG